MWRRVRVGLTAPARDLITDPARRGRALDYLFERVLDGRFKMPIAHQFTISEAAEAHRRLEENRHVGKIVMTP